MKTLQLHAVVILAMIGTTASAEAHPPRTNVSFGIRFGGPVYRPGPCYHPCYGPRIYSIYRPAPVYYYTRPRVIVEPAPVVIQRPTVVVPRAPALQPVQQVSASSPTPDTSISQHLQQLTNPSEKVRSDAVMALGRSKAAQTVDRLNAVLAGDKSAIVRDAAARALGLIGSPNALPTLTYAAQADTDRDVRRSAQFAIDVIQANQRR